MTRVDPPAANMRQDHNLVINQSHSFRLCLKIEPRCHPDSPGFFLQGLVAYDGPLFPQARLQKLVRIGFCALTQSLKFFRARVSCFGASESSGKSNILEAPLRVNRAIPI